MTDFFLVENIAFMELQSTQPFCSSEQVRLTVETTVSYLQNRNLGNISQQSLNMQGQTSSWVWVVSDDLH